MKIAAFHVGAHKTGTSAVQWYLRDHEAELRRAGLLTLTRRELDECVGWGEVLVEHPHRLRGLLDRFRRDEARALLASNENVLGKMFHPHHAGLYPWAARNLAALAALTGDLDRKVVLGVRPQHQVVESWYLQTVHQGARSTFREWFARVHVERLSWRPVVEAARASFGSENVTVIDFRTIADGQDAYIRRILAAVDPAFDRPVVTTRKSNRSISGKGLDIALAVNPVLTGDEQRFALRRFLQTHFSNAEYPRPRLLTDDERALLLDRYADEYDDLVRAPVPTA